MSRELQTPSDKPIRWRITDRSTGQFVEVREMHWVVARDAGARLLSVDRYAVTCVRVEEE